MRGTTYGPFHSSQNLTLVFIPLWFLQWILHAPLQNVLTHCESLFWPRHRILMPQCSMWVPKYVGVWDEKKNLHFHLGGWMYVKVVLDKRYIYLSVYIWPSFFGSGNPLRREVRVREITFCLQGLVVGTMVFVYIWFTLGIDTLDVSKAFEIVSR